MKYPSCRSAESRTLTFSRTYASGCRRGPRGLTGATATKSPSQSRAKSRSSPRLAMRRVRAPAARGRAMREAMGAAESGKHGAGLLPMGLWHLAWSRCAPFLRFFSFSRSERFGCRYTIAAVAAKQLSLAECTAHRDNCMKVAVQAAAFAAGRLALPCALAGKRREASGAARYVLRRPVPPGIRSVARRARARARVAARRSGPSAPARLTQISC